MMRASDLCGAEMMHNMRPLAHAFTDPKGYPGATGRTQQQGAFAFWAA